MVRTWRLGNFLRETFESPLIEKLSFILPFVVITVDIILIEHAVRINEHYIIALTTLLFFLSTIEIIVILEEIRERHKESTLERTLTIKLDKFMLRRDVKNVKNIVKEFIKFHPQYKKNTGKVYHIACQIIENKKDG